MLIKEVKEKLMKKFGRHKGDTGSSEVQIAILSEEIKELLLHLKEHKKDFSSRRGLLKKVAERRKLLRYLEHENAEGFQKIIKSLKLKAPKKVEVKGEILAPDAAADDAAIEAVAAV